MLCILSGSYSLRTGPDHLEEVYEIVDYVKTNFTFYMGMHLVMLFNEPFVKNGYPNMIPADKRNAV